MAATKTTGTVKPATTPMSGKPTKSVAPTGKGSALASPNDTTTQLTVRAEPGFSEMQMLVKASLSPSVGAARVVQQTTHQLSGLDLTTISWYFKQAAEVAAGGDLNNLQQMLVVQARTLDLIYNDFAIRAGMCTGLDAKEQCLRLAMKAQSQCRTTVESIAVIQQGPAIFARQANIAHGHMQVNSGGVPPAVTAETRAPVDKTSAPNELLEDGRGKRMDTRAARTAGKANPVVATMGKRDRATER